ncbi:MAG TPA: EscE/YscE/SsaE family type III secretion system needle protein co-chaperone [Burkholderiaceae bacterium]|nr:EscE/YscE/SsaE family type III secretion system needle protein co-chaperone [Burkholderiaceae bacterium]
MVVTDLEQQLQGPQAPQVRQRLLGSLQAIEHRLQAQVRGGLQPDKFEQIRACAQACADAQHVVRHYGQPARGR